jgi:hypothetical protein
MNARRTLVVDRTHLGRRASGIKRITEELFSDEALRPLPVEGFGASGTGKLMWRRPRWRGCRWPWRRDRPLFGPSRASGIQ